MKQGDELKMSKRRVWGLPKHELEWAEVGKGLNEVNVAKKGGEKLAKEQQKLLHKLEGKGRSTR